MANLHTSLSLLDSLLAQLHHVYRDFQRVRSDAAELFRSTPTLTPHKGQCVRSQPPLNTPHISDLLKVAGSIPIIHRNITYEVLIEVWIPESYPYAAPVCKVIPSPGLPIKQLHLHVDSQGNIYSPYITYWNATSSNLIGLISAIARSFTENFPFELNHPPPPLHEQSLPPPPPPPQVAPSNSTPTLPYSSALPNGHPMHYYSTPLPYGGQPHTPQQSEDSLPLPFAQPRPGFPSPPVLSATTHHPLPSSSVHTPLGATLGDHAYEAQPAGYYASTSPSQQHQPLPPPPPPHVEEEVSLMSFQRAYEDPVVLRNNLLKSLTERTQQRLKSFFGTTTKEVEELMEANQALKKKLHDAGNHRLNEALDTAGREQQEQQKQVAETTAWLAANDKGDSIDVDEVTEPKDPLCKQLIHIIAEDAAYDDAYYQLEQLLAAGKIDLQSFLKTSRGIAREQFMCRALIKKITGILNDRNAQRK